MDSSEPTRRAFLSSTAYALGGGWLMLYLPEIEAAAASARAAARTGFQLSTLTAHEARTLAAAAARLLPSGDGPGAAEAGVVPFMDRALGSFFGFMLQAVRDGVRDLDEGSQRAGGVDFAAADAATQDAVLRQIEATGPFFNVRLLTICAVFSDPSYGGNRDATGDRLLGIERRAAYQPPFGYYDAEYARAGGR